MKGYYAAGWCSVGFIQMMLISILTYMPVLFLGLVSKIKPELEIQIGFYLIPTFIISLCMPLIMGFFHIKWLQKKYGSLTAKAALYMFANTNSGEPPKFQSSDELHKAVMDGKYPNLN